MADFLMVVNSGVNVVIYCAFNPMFRERFHELYLRRIQSVFCNLYKSTDDTETFKAFMSLSELPKKSTQLTDTLQLEHQETAL